MGNISNDGYQIWHGHCPSCKRCIRIEEENEHSGSKNVDYTFAVVPNSFSAVDIGEYNWISVYWGGIQLR